MDFMYTSVARLRSEGLTAADLSDALAIQRISLISRMINRITGQYFQPVWYEALKLSGRDSPLIFLPDLEPIIKIVELALTPKGYDPEILEEDDYVLHSERFIARIASTVGRVAQLASANWVEGYSNYTFKGYAGWLEDVKEVEANIVTADLVQDAEEIEVDDASNFDEGDFVVVVSGDDRFGALLNSVDYGDNKFGIDKAQTKGKTYPIDADVITFGKVPIPIVWACTRMVVNQSALLIPDGGEIPDPAFESKLKTEKTDNYSYTLFSPRELMAESGSIAAGDFTGDPGVDMVLATFTAPSIALSV